MGLCMTRMKSCFCCDNSFQSQAGQVAKKAKKKNNDAESAGKPSSVERFARG